MIEEYLGFESDYIIIGLAAVALFLLLWGIINTVRIGKLNKRLAAFMKGKSAESLENTLIKRLEEVDELTDRNASNTLCKPIFCHRVPCHSFSMNVG